MLLSKYKRKPEAWNKHVVPYYKSEATSSSADTAHPFRLIPWLLELDSGTGYSLEGLMLKLKLQYFGHLMWRIDSLENTLMMGGIRGRRRRGHRGWDGWMASLTQWTWVWVNSGRWWWTGRPGLLWFIGSQRVGHDWVSELNWEAFLGDHDLKMLGANRI